MCCEDRPQPQRQPKRRDGRQVKERRPVAPQIPSYLKRNNRAAPDSRRTKKPGLGPGSFQIPV
jgi:hypothetical protein